ncbi:MAG: hypothetical protein CM15mP45_11640 [Deltaproteobacteria bacterium]|nr:MAG: hypothetical protein CM15mP45_11640 [Deltaproteobacteria bacterium]
MHLANLWSEETRLLDHRLSDFGDHQLCRITKGTGRIAEVAARFTLDAMPGKQMAIDADLNAGLIDDSEARTRRRVIQRESDYFGALMERVNLLEAMRLRVCSSLRSTFWVDSSWG